jgi:hypothetical protein
MNAGTTGGRTRTVLVQRGEVIEISDTAVTVIPAR